MLQASLNTKRKLVFFYTTPFESGIHTTDCTTSSFYPEYKFNLELAKVRNWGDSTKFLDWEVFIGNTY